MSLLIITLIICFIVAIVSINIQNIYEDYTRGYCAYIYIYSNNKIELKIVRDDDKDLTGWSESRSNDRWIKIKKQYRVQLINRFWKYIRLKKVYVLEVEELCTL